jgi:hypothetical protein
MGGITVEYFRNRPEAAIFGQVLQQRPDKFSRLFFTFSTESIDLKEAFHERP